jgi:hypothetical protein
MNHLSGHSKIRSSAPLGIVAISFLVAVQIAQAHVDLEDPNGGQMLAGGSSFTIAWRPAVAMHDTLNFDLWYSTTADSGPWTAIASDLPPGDLAVGSFHSFAWTVPSINDASVWVRVRQDNNVDQDYEDVSNNPFSISAALAGDFNGDGSVNAADYVRWRKTGGTQAQFNTWRTNFGEASGNGGQASLDGIAVLEPEGLVLVVAVLIVSFGTASRRFPSALFRQH